LVDGDCDDSDAGIHPAADEHCDGIDEDCDGAVDEGVTSRFWPDSDGDGYGTGRSTPVEACAVPSGYSASRGDCDDGDEGISPGEVESCDNGVDDDCDGLSDCEDSDCLDECTESTCDDGLDEDGDGDVDCDDDDCLATCYLSAETWVTAGHYEWSLKEGYHTDWRSWNASDISGSLRLTGLETTTCTWTATDAGYSWWSGTVTTRGLVASSDCPLQNPGAPFYGGVMRPNGNAVWPGVVTTSWTTRAYVTSFSSTYSHRGYWDTHWYASGELTTGNAFSFTPSF
jgi:hypothetical protein